MKTYTTWMKAFFFAMATAFTMASCTYIEDPVYAEDRAESINLSGQWYGDFGMNYTYVYRGHEYIFDSYDTDIVFYPDYDYATHGWGKQVDWYENGPYEKMYYRFNWSIRNGNLYINYPSAPELNTIIYDYSMTSGYFGGWIGDSNIKFRLRKIADYYDWTCYYDDYYCYNRYDWAWGPRYAKGTAASDSTATATADEGTIVSRGRRTNK